MSLYSINNFFFLSLKNLILIYPKFLLSVKLDFLGNDLLNCYYCKKPLYAFYFFSYSTFFRFKQCVENTLIDTLNIVCRFKLVYCILSLTFNKRLNLIFNITEALTLISVSFVFASVNWLEREIYDMFGFYFFGHINLKRILTDYGFSSFPLRKDFPLIGFFEIYYSNYLNKIKYIKI